MDAGRIALLIVAGLFLLIGVVACSAYSYANGIRGEFIRKEVALSAQYGANQNELSTFISKFYETLSIANLKSEQMNQILTDAVKGRYDSSGGFKTPGNALFSAIMEAYPQLDLGIYDKIVDQVSAGREAYKNVQNKLLDMLRAMDTYRNEDIFRSMALGLFNMPDANLVARVGETAYTGEAARAKMYQIVLTGDALKAYQNGTMEPLKAPHK